MKLLQFFVIIVLIPTLCLAQQKKPSSSREDLLKNVSQGLHKSAPIELKALEIRAKIYEPQMIYVLDRSKIDINFQEEKIQFSDRVELPITLNNLE